MSRSHGVNQSLGSPRDPAVAVDDHRCMEGSPEEHRPSADTHTHHANDHSLTTASDRKGHGQVAPNATSAVAVRGPHHLRLALRKVSSPATQRRYRRSAV